MAIEEPKFEVLLTDGAFEIRKYAPYIVAETMVEGDMDQASSKGFRLIADYIFGNNQAVSSASSEKIAMTAPVTVTPPRGTSGRLPERLLRSGSRSSAWPFSNTRNIRGLQVSKVLSCTAALNEILGNFMRGHLGPANQRS